MDRTVFDSLRRTPETFGTIAKDDMIVYWCDADGGRVYGAPRDLLESLGATPGGVPGVQGGTYALPVTQGGVQELKPYVDDLLELASEWDENMFYVTRGVGAYADEEVAPLFAGVVEMYNVLLPEAYMAVIGRMLWPED